MAPLGPVFAPSATLRGHVIGWSYSAEALRGALTGLKGAQEWAATVLKTPAEVLVDLSADAINRLRTLPPWL